MGPLAVWTVPAVWGGEAGAQHLVIWCPAVALAWRGWAGGQRRTLVETLLDPGDDAAILAIFLQQVSFLHCSLLGCAVLEAAGAASRLQRACERNNAVSAWDDAGSGSEGEELGDEEGEVVDAWAPSPVAQECPQCSQIARMQLGVRASAAPSSQAMSRGGGEVVLRPVCASDTVPGFVLALLFSSVPVAGWLPPGRGWWPRPRRVDPLVAGARWQVEQCSGCGVFRATLTAARHLPRGFEVTVDSNPSPEGEDASWPWEVTFDGGARGTRVGPLAGAGAALWKHNLGGGAPTLVAQTVVAIPWGATAQVAEAHGCCAALGLLRFAEGGPRRARVVGDNLAVIRYGAATASLRAIAQQAIMEVSLADVYLLGWCLDWQAVRRHLNTTADALATEGICLAAQEVSGGRRALVARNE